MNQKSYGVLLLSFSKHSHQRSFVPLFLDHPRTRIVAVADEPDIEPYLKDWNESWAQELGVPYIEDVSLALERSDVDVVSIGHEIERRATLILKCAGAGKHLWIDKFIGANIEECDTVVEGILRAGVKTIVPGYTYGELVERSLALVRHGGLRTLMGVHADLMFAKGKPVHVGAADIQRPFLPAGAWKFSDVKRELLTVGAYAVALIQRCLSDVKCVWGQGDAYFFPEHAARAAEDFGTLSMTDINGSIATISGSRTGVASHNAGGLSSAYLVGSHGTAHIDATRPALDEFIRSDITGADYSVPEDDPMQWASRAPGQRSAVSPNPLARGLDDFISAIDRDISPSYTVDDARKHMEILLAGYQSIVTGELVRLPLVRGASS
ncbi:MAG: Gfo/Idh/MocA family oxidoreductase [Candidatus Latescibacteria bacterium]|nr:Gfo/Idh/MocA family oxidoreductase [Candidatus Latescibacterota bacterium]